MSAIDSKRFTALGREWTARFDFNAICELEEVTGQGFGEIVGPFLGALDAKDRDNADAMVRLVSKVRGNHLRMILFVALSGEHPEATPELAGKIIGDIGIGGAMPVIGWAIVKGLGFDSDDEAGEGDDAAGTVNPPKKKPRKGAHKAG